MMVNCTFRYQPPSFSALFYTTDPLCYSLCENFGLLPLSFLFHSVLWLAVTSLTRRPNFPHLVYHEWSHPAGGQRWPFPWWAHEFGCVEVSLDQIDHEPTGKPCLVRSLRKNWNVTRRNVGNDGRTDFRSAATVRFGAPGRWCTDPGLYWPW